AQLLRQRQSRPIVSLCEKATANHRPIFLSGVGRGLLIIQCVCSGRCEGVDVVMGIRMRPCRLAGSDCEPIGSIGSLARLGVGPRLSTGAGAQPRIGAWSPSAENAVVSVWPIKLNQSDSPPACHYGPKRNWIGSSTRPAALTEASWLSGTSVASFP